MQTADRQQAGRQQQTAVCAHGGLYSVLHCLAVFVHRLCSVLLVVTAVCCVARGCGYMQCWAACCDA